MNTSRLWLAAVVLLASMLFAAPAAAVEPQVVFVVQDGWLEMTLTRDEQPLADAEIRVYTANGQAFAAGETGPEGRGAFPLPPGPRFHVEIKVAGRTADSIQLTMQEGQVVPNRVLLSFGLAPCCKVPSHAAADADSAASLDPAPGSIPVWLQMLGGAGFTIVGAVILVVSCYPSDRSVPKEMR